MDYHDTVENDGEIVETSDNEEREAIQWQRTADAFLALKTSTGRASSTRLHSSQAVLHSPSPRKRVKLVHELLTAPLYRAPHPAHSSSSPDTTISDDHKHSQSPTLIPSTSTLSLSASPNSSSPIPTPGVSSDDARTNEARWDVMAETFGNSQDPLNMFMSQEIGYGQGEPDYERAMSFSQDSAEDKSYMEAEVEVQSTHQPLRRLSRSRSRSRSTDQLQLFTSPHDSKLKYVYSPIAIPASPLCVTVPDNPRTPSQDYTLLSPHHSLTTPNLSSKLVTVTTRSQSPVSPENKTSPLTPSSSPPQQPYAEGDEDLARQFVEDQESRRYSMRARRPQQLNPYVYDKLLYKRQMKSNPDAIVKFASPKRRNHSHGGDGEDLMTQDGETQDWNMDVDGDDEDASWVDKHQRRSQKERPRNGDAEVPLESQDASGDLPSSDEDPDIKEMLKEAKKIKERARLKERGKLKEKEQEEREREKRWRLKPFPLRREKGKMKHKEFTAKQHDQEIEGVPGIVPPSPSFSLFELPRQPHDLRSPRLETPKSPAISIQSSPRHAEFTSHDNYDYPAYEDDDWAGNAEFSGTDFQYEPSMQQPQPDQEDDPAKVQSHSRDSNASDSNSDSSSQEMTAKDRKRLKALQHMMPAHMALQLVKGDQKKITAAKRQQSAAAPSNSEMESGPLPPGKTRVRLGERGRDAEIRGDTESSDPEPSAADRRGLMFSAPESDSDDIVASPKDHRKRETVPHHTTYISDDTLEEESSDDEVDDAKIDAWFRHRQHSAETASTRHSGRLRDQGLVDYMLTKTRTVGGSGRNKERKKTISRTTTEPRARAGHIHVVTAGARRERQTLLSFSKQEKQTKGANGIHRPRSSKKSPVDQMSEIFGNEIESNNNWGDEKYSTLLAAAKKKTKKTKIIPGLHTFTSHNTRITSGRRGFRNAITIEAEDEGLYQALVPSREPGKDARSAPTRRKPKLRPMETGDTHVDSYAPADANIDCDHPAKHNRDNVPYSTRHRRDIKADFDIPFLPSGIAFQPHTYIGKGLLHELVNVVSGDDNIVVPNSYSAHGIELGPATTPSHLATSFPLITHGLLSFIFGPADNLTTETMHHWESIMRVVCQLLSWVPANSTMEECVLLATSLQEQVLRLINDIDHKEGAFGHDGVPMNAMVLTCYWFAIEALVRFSCSVQKNQVGLTFDAKNLVKYMLLLARRLSAYNLERTLNAVITSHNGLDTTLVPERAAELWICLFHLVSNCDVVMPDDSKPAHTHAFWRITHLTLQHDEGFPDSGLEASENTWRTIFSLCALAQFSVHGMTTSVCRLPASWDLVAFALKQIRLAAEPEKDRKLSERSIDKRDDYIWIIASRCFILNNRWQWRLDDASAMFNQLVDIFRSRRFANLRKEPSDFPSFMLHNDLHLLSKYQPSDTAFELFLKLIVQAAQDSVPHGDANAERTISSKLKKLLSLAIPVGSVPFTKDTPPSTYELSMLYNRLSAIAVAIYLDSSAANAKFRIGYARRYVSFKNADIDTRLACIRGMMYFAIIMRYRHLPLDEVLSWLAEMTDTLVDEYQEIDSSIDKTGGGQPPVALRNRAVLAVQVLLGSLRYIIEAPNIDPMQPQKSLYPEPILLDGPWVKRIFATSTNLAHVAGTGKEIRKLVQAFLDARRAAMTTPQRSFTVTSGNNGDSQESQDDYGAFDLDLDDPELLAALGNEEHSIVQDNKLNEELVCDVIDKHITPAIYRLVTKHFSDPSGTQSFQEYCQAADQWIDCWVGCASVVIQNGRKQWDTFLKLGPFSWERIIDASWRRRVGLRFMFMLLRLDPEAYTNYNDRFIPVLLQSFVSRKVTLENEYMALVLTIDHLKHPLLRHIPCQLKPGATEYSISISEFLDLRLVAVEIIFSNLADNIRKEKEGRHDGGQNQTHIGFIISMLSTMKDVHEQIINESDELTQYTALCREILLQLERHPELKSQPRFAEFISWGATLTAA